ncbi:MAG: response regulator [Candidatus Tectimicrobiota bacterium]
MRILLVDDNSEDLDALGALLQHHGYEVTLAHNGADALEHALHEPYQAIIADVLMPQMDGLQLCRTIKTHERLSHVPFIFHTATCIEAADEALALSLGADRFVVKGRNAGVLLAVLQEVLRSQAAGILHTSRPALDCPPASLQAYDTTLIARLEERLQQLEQSNRQLRESEEHYRRLADAANDAILCIDLRGRLRFANLRFSELSGYTLAEATHLRFSRLLPPEDVGMVMEYLWQHLTGSRPPQIYTLRWLTKAGHILYVDMSVSVVVQHGQLTGLHMLVRDMSTCRQTELHLTGSAPEAPKQVLPSPQQAQKLEAIGTLAAGIAHDFNNIFSAVLGYTELSLSDAPAESLLAHNLQEVLRAGARGRDLVQHLLRFSRQSEQIRQALNLCPLLQETLSHFCTSLPATVTLEQYLRPDAGLVLADAAQIHQLCLHLCRNAVQAMGVAGGVLSVHLEPVEVDQAFATAHPALRPGPHVRLTVRDTGHGMSPAILERIFEPFYTTRGVGEGIGLGLSIVHGIVTAHDGLITVTSVLGMGSTFMVYLPQVQRFSAALIGPSGPLPQGTERLLFIDQEVALGNMVQDLLERLGYSVTVCLSSLEALDEYRTATQPFALVIVDQAMPQMTGEALAVELHRLTPQLPVLLCTTFSYNMTPERAQVRGISAVLLKPLILHELAYSVRRVLDQQAQP